jgi:galactose mutarotase-like enzyme
MKKIDAIFGECVALKDGGVDALVAPELGMSLVRFSVDGESLLDLQREQVFLEYRKGLGPIILPFFGQRVKFPELNYDQFPHVHHLRRLNIKDPFQHGVGRYASWSFEQDNNRVTGHLKGDDRLHDCKLKQLTGFDFTASLTYSLTGRTLEIAFDVAANRPIATGIHFYYDLKNRDSASVTIPQDNQTDVVRFDRGLDDVFIPSTASEQVTYTLETDTYILKTRVRVVGPPSETFNSVVVFSPENEGYACIEPVSYIVRSENNKRTNRGKILITPTSKN